MPQSTYFEFDVNGRNTPVDALISRLVSGQINVDPPYQRGLVWGIDRSRNLIRSMLLGLPIGAVYINDRGTEEGYICLDGKQRLTAISEFMADSFAVPRTWANPLHVDAALDGEEFVYSQMTKLGQRCFEDSTVLTYFTNMKGKDAQDQEFYLFGLINNGGIPQGESD